MIRELAANKGIQTEALLLIEKIRKGDKAAFGILYDRFAPVLLGIIRKQVSDTRKSEAILQKTFLRIYSEIASFDPSCDSLFSWLLTITHKMISKNNPENPSGDNFVGSSDALAKTPDEMTMNNKYLTLDLLILKGYSFAQATKVSGLPPGELKKKLQEEFKQLRTVNPNE